MSTKTKAALVAALFLLMGLALAGARPGIWAPVAAALPPILGASLPLGDAMPDAVVDLNDDNFAKQVERAQGLVLVDFFATWCSHCKAMKPIFHAVAKEYKDKMKFGALDTDQAQITTNKYKVDALPTLILFKDGKQVDQKVGECGQDEIKAMIDPYLK